MQKQSQLMQELRPWIVDLVSQLTRGQASANGGSAALIVHDIASPWHSGTMRDDQAPQFLLRSGVRSLTGNLAVDSGVTIDGVDLDVHAANPSAHHAPVGVTGGLTLAGQNIAVGQGNGIAVNTGDVAVRLATNSGLTFSSATLTMGTPSTLTVSTTSGVTGANHAHAITSTSNATGASLLATDASGYLTLVRLTATDRIRSPLFDTAAGDMTLQPADRVLLGTGKVIQSNAFTSGFAGGGWRIDDGVSRVGYTTVEADDLVVRGILRVYELLIHKIRTGNGSYLFANGGKVASVTGAGPYTLTFDEDHGLVADDLIRAQKFTGSGTYQSNCQVTSAPTTKTLIVTLTSGNAPAAGYEYVRLGSTSNADRRGGVYITADDSNAPFLDIFDGVSSFAEFGSASKTKVRLGKLTGITSIAGEYGLLAGSGVANTDAYIRLSNSAARFNNIPIQMYNAGTQTVNINAAGNDIWIGPSSADKRLTWNGSTLTIVGAITVTNTIPAGSISGLAATATSSDFASVTGATKPANNATVGATWGANLSSIPTRFGDAPSAAGLYLTGSNLGYYNGSAWTCWIASDGQFYFGGSTGARLQWNGSTLAGYDSSNTQQWYASATDGTLRAGGGNAWMNASGFGLAAAAGKFTGSTITWWYGAARMLNIGMNVDLGAPVSAFIETLSSAYPLNIGASSVVFSGSATVNGSIVASGGGTLSGSANITNASNNGIFLSADYASASYLQAYNNSSATYRPMNYEASVHVFGVGSVGIGAWPAEKLDVTGNIRMVGNAYCYTTGYLVVRGEGELYLRSNTATYVNIADDNGATVRIGTGGGNTLVGTTSNTYGAKLNVAGNIHTSGAMTSELFAQLKAVTTPATASGWARIFLRSSDNALCVVMPSGNVRVLANN